MKELVVHIIARLRINSSLISHCSVIASQVVELDENASGDCIWTIKKQTLPTIAYCTATDCVVTERPIAIVRIAIRSILENASGPDKILDVSEIWPTYQSATEYQWSLDLLY